MKKTGAVGAVVFALLIIVGLFVLIKGTVKIPVGYEGVVYSVQGGVQDTTLTQGWHIVSPMKHVKEFTIGNEQLILTKDNREGSKGNDSFKVATSDDASIAISFQMSYRFVEKDLVDTYKKFKGMDGSDIIENRVKAVLKSKVSEVTTDYSMMQIYSGNRNEINDKITEYLDKEFQDEYGIEVIDASIIDVHPDKKLKKAIDNRVTALQEKQQAQAEQEKVKVETETKQIQAEADAKVKITQAEADAQVKLKQAQAEAESNKEISKTITDELIRMKEADARLAHGWVTTTGASTVVTEGN